MSSDQGWFESDEAYQRRLADEADERTIENASGSAPSQGWFESDDSYRDRVSREANEYRIEEATGDAPSQGWFESDNDYRDRIEQEANERTVEDLNGSAPSKGWFESDDDYRVRVRREANESIIENGEGESPRQGWFEGDHAYRSRVAHEARRVRARPTTDNALDWELGSEGDPYRDQQPAGGSTGVGATAPTREPVRREPRLDQLETAAAMSESELEREIDLRIREEVARSYREFTPHSPSDIPLVTREDLIRFTVLNGHPLPHVVWMAESHRKDGLFNDGWGHFASLFIEARAAANPMVREAWEGLREQSSLEQWAFPPKGVGIY